MHSLPLLRSLTKEASRCVYPAAWRLRHVLPSALSGTTGRLPHPRQPRLAVLRNLARIVVGYNDHLREESYNHYILAPVGMAFAPGNDLLSRSLAEACGSRTQTPHF